MKVLIIIASTNNHLIKTAKKNENKLLNQLNANSLVSQNASLLLTTFNNRNQNFEQFLLDKIEETSADGVVALIEEPLIDLIKNIKYSIFSSSIPKINYSENISNFLIGKLRTLLKNYGFFLHETNNATNFQAIALPFLNFHSQPFYDLLFYCETGTLEDNFQNTLKAKINKVLKSRGPKRRSSYPDVYFKDQESRYFIYGKEMHSKPETGVPHEISCHINAKFRFGKQLEYSRHYNVSIGESDKPSLITCAMPNCHGAIVNTNNKSHINMFSSNFHK